MDIFIGRNGETLGSFNEDQVRSMLQSSLLLPTDLFWHEGQPGWLPLGEWDNAPLVPVTVTQSVRPDIRASCSRWFLIAGYCFTVLSFFVLPFAFAAAGMTVGLYALKRNEPGHGILIAALSVILPIAGFAIRASGFV